MPPDRPPPSPRAGDPHVTHRFKSWEERCEETWTHPGHCAQRLDHRSDDRHPDARRACRGRIRHLAHDEDPATTGIRIRQLRVGPAHVERPTIVAPGPGPVVRQLLPVGERGLPGLPGLQRQGEPELPERHRRRPPGPGQAQNETAIAADPERRHTWSRRTTTTGAATAPAASPTASTAGRTWSDATTPNGFTRGTAFGGFAREYWQAGGDTSVAWDTKGNAYLSARCSCAAPASRPTPTSPARSTCSGPPGTAARRSTSRAVRWSSYNDTAGSGCCLSDKPYMTVDNNLGQPVPGSRLRDLDVLRRRRDRRTSTIPTPCDYGEHFSKPVVVSTTSSLCPNTSACRRRTGNCNENQFSDPFVGPDGTLYVVYSNFNNARQRCSENRTRS